MNNETRKQVMALKPKRENFASDDDFGEAYAAWLAIQKKLAPDTAPASAPPKPATAPSPQAKTGSVARPAARQIPPSAKTPPSPQTNRVSARNEAERDTWNLITKARFARAKESARTSKDNPGQKN